MTVTLQEPEPIIDPFASESIFDVPVHPVASIFALMPEAALQELAEDIAANGLQNPLLVFEGQLVDGRNRRAACERVGVIPSVIELPAGTDVTAIVLSQNATRRHSSQSQVAMAFALAYPESPEHGGRGKTSILKMGVSRDLITKARYILREADDLVEQVKLGVSVGQAYAVAFARVQLRLERERRLTSLRTSHPEISERVDAGTWTIEHALHVAHVADEEQATRKVLREKQEALARLIKSVVPGAHAPNIFDGPQPMDPPDEQQRVLERLVTLDHHLSELAQQRVVEGWWQPGYLAGVRKVLSSIASNAERMAAAHDPEAIAEVGRADARAAAIGLRR